MLLMCLPLVIYTASMQMFLDSFASPIPVRARPDGDH
jgi:hypothetical protein